MRLKTPNDSIAFFQDLKIKSEAYWTDVELKENVYGFQIQAGTKWNKGLSEAELIEFQRTLGIVFPESLKNFYRVMNGVNLPGVNIYANCGIEKSYAHKFYAYPRDLQDIRDRIDWIYEVNEVSDEVLVERNISRIFPIYAHRFVLIDAEENILLSMHGNDIIFLADNISKGLVKDIFGSLIENTAVFESDFINSSNVKFWLEI